MKRYIFFALLFFSAAFCSPKSSLSLAPIYNRSGLNAEGLGDFKGNVFGAEVKYQFLENNSWFVQLLFEGTMGELKDSSNTIDLSNFYGALKVGYNYFYDKNIKSNIIPYIGSGYHILEEKQHILGFSPVTYSYFIPYIPIGLYAQFTPRAFFSFGLHVEYQFDVETYLEINSLTGARWELKRKPSWLAELPITWNVTEKFHVAFVPYYSFFRTGRSTAETSSGLQLGIQQQRLEAWGGKIAFSRLF